MPWGINSIKDGIKNYKKLTQKEFEQRIKNTQDQIEKNKEEKNLLQKEMAIKCEEKFNNLPTTGYSPYLAKKQVDDIETNIRYKDDSLVIPLQDIEGKIWNLQTIDPKGQKRFESKARKQGNFFTISKDQILDDNKPLLIAEGLATALTVHRVSKLDTIVCFDSGNMLKVVDNIKEKYPDKKIIITADDDLKLSLKTGINSGLDSSNKVQEKYPDIAILEPTLTKEEKIEKGLSDFNDLEKVRGQEFLKTRFDEVLKELGLQETIKSGFKIQNL